MEESNDNLGSVDPNEGGVDAPDAGQSTPVTETEGESQSAQPESSVEDQRFQGEDGVQKLEKSYQESEAELRRMKEADAKHRKLAESLEAAGYSVDEVLSQLNPSVERPDLGTVDQPHVDPSYNQGSQDADEVKRAALNTQAMYWELKAEKEAEKFKESHPDVPEDVVEEIKGLGFTSRYNNMSYDQIYDKLYAPVVRKTQEATHQNLEHKRMTQPTPTESSPPKQASDDAAIEQAMRDGKWKDPQYMAQLRKG